MALRRLRPRRPLEPLGVAGRALTGALAARIRPGSGFRPLARRDFRLA
jgi:hypothetical protein